MTSGQGPLFFKLLNRVQDVRVSRSYASLRLPAVARHLAILLAPCLPVKELWHGWCRKPTGVKLGGALTSLVAPWFPEGKNGAWAQDGPGLTAR